MPNLARRWTTHVSCSPRRQREAELQKRLKAANKKERGEVSESAKVRDREAKLQAELAALENPISESRPVRSPSWLGCRRLPAQRG